jgi:hypothetical protein
MSFAIGFVSFREGQVKRDTIPKPVGLGSRGSREARSVRCAFIEYSMNIRWLFNVCSMQMESRCTGARRVSRGFANGR